MTFFKKNCLELLWGCNVERMPYRLVDFVFRIFYSGGQFRVVVVKCLRVKVYSVKFHLRKNRHKFHFCV